jgi:hypothetical protein
MRDRNPTQRPPSVRSSPWACLPLLGALAGAACAPSSVSTARSPNPMTSPVPTTSAATTATAPSDRAALLESKSRSLIGAAAKGDFDLASRDFDDQVKQGLPPSAFAATWKGIEAQVGTLTSITSVAFTNDAEHPYDDVLCAFERASLLVRVAFDADGRIAGLHFRPARPPGPPRRTRSPTRSTSGRSRSERSTRSPASSRFRAGQRRLPSSSSSTAPAPTTPTRRSAAPRCSRTWRGGSRVAASPFSAT